MLVVAHESFSSLKRILITLDFLDRVSFVEELVVVRILADVFLCWIHRRTLSCISTGLVDVLWYHSRAGRYLILVDFMHDEWSGSTGSGNILWLMCPI